MPVHSELTKFLRTPATSLIALSVTKGHIYSLEEGYAFEVLFASQCLSKEFEHTPGWRGVVTMSQLLGPRKSICEILRTHAVIKVTKFRKARFYLRRVEFDADRYREKPASLPGPDSSQKTLPRPAKQGKLESAYSFADLPGGVAKARAYYSKTINRQLKTGADPDFIPKLTMLFKVSKGERTRIKAIVKKLTTQGMSAISQQDAAAFVRLWKIRNALRKMLSTSGDALLGIGNQGLASYARLVGALTQWHHGQRLLTEIMKQILKEKEH